MTGEKATLAVVAALAAIGVARQKGSLSGHMGPGAFDQDRYNNTDTYSIDLDNMTVLRNTPAGEVINLDSTGDGCETVSDLADFIHELHAVDFINEAVRDELLADLRIEIEIRA
jgi:hypothetical protein